MNQHQSIVSTIQSHAPQLRSYGVTRIGVFGSQIRGTATERSDVDVLVDFASGKKTYRNFIGTTSYPEEILQRPVDTITAHSISPYFKPYIEKEIRYVRIKP